MTVRLRIIETVPDLLELRPEWSTLASSDRLTPFQTFAWNQAWWTLVGSLNRSNHLHVVVVEDTAGIMAIAPLFVDARENLVTLRVIGDPFADYHDVLLREGGTAAAIDEIVRHVLDGLGIRWDLINLSEIAPWSPLLMALARRSTRGRFQVSSACPRLRLDDPIASSSILGRGEHARKKRRLENLGRLECLYHSTAEMINVHLSAYMQMHMNQWLERPNCGITFQDPEIVRFYSGSVQALADAGLLMLVELRLGMRPIAFYYGYTFGTTFWGYRPTFDTDFARFSPGHVMHNLMFSGLLQRGFRAFDFMRGSFEYKFRYASQISWNMRYTLGDS